MQCDLVWTHWLVFLVTANFEHVIKCLHEFPKNQSSFILVHRPISHKLKKLCNHESNKSFIPLHDYNFKLISCINFVECKNVLISLLAFMRVIISPCSQLICLWFSWVHLSLLNLNFGWEVSSSHCFFSLLINQCSYVHFAMKHILTIDVVCFV